MRIMNYEAENLFCTGWADYALIDSGAGRKLERFGPYHFIRPEPQALWAPFRDEQIWHAHDGMFNAQNDETGRWVMRKTLPPKWEMQFEALRFYAQPTPFRHLGFFPEQSPHWQWAAEQSRNFTQKYQRPLKLLNLFAYSGLASLHAAQAGAEVTHVDASKKAIAWAFDNRNLSGLEQHPIRFITDDAMQFVKREIRRGRTYDAIILDPPKYGRGPKGEIWQMYEHLPALLTSCRALLSATPQFVILTLYAIRLSRLALLSALADSLAGLGGGISAGELAIREERTHGRAIGQALYARWAGAA